MDAHPGERIEDTSGDTSVRGLTLSGAVALRQPSRLLSTAVVLVALAAFLALAAWQGGLFAGKTVGAYCVVHTSDGLVETLPLDVDIEKTYVTDLGSNTVRVRDGAVAIIAADCKNHNCIVQGSISAVGEQIVCLPHRFYVEIVADPAASGQTAPASGEGVSGYDTLSY